MSTERKFLTNEQVVRLMISVFLIGGAWARLEYKMDQMNEKTKGIFKEYVIANDKDKDFVNYRLSQMQSQVDVNSVTIKAIADFIKPQPEIKQR